MLYSLHAQPPGFRKGAPSGPSIKGKITGTVLDSVTQSPVEFATLVLINPKDSSQVNGGITNEKGFFKLQDVPTGTYKLQLSFIGYTTETIHNVQLTLEKPDTDLGTLLLQPDGVMLNEVEVTETRAIIENRIDKIVFNAEQDVTTVGGDAADVLRKAPLLTVDIDGNISLRGSQNVQILINGRPSSLFAQNPGEALRSIPADQIKSVEVITTPSARYEHTDIRGDFEDESGLAFTNDYGNVLPSIILSRTLKRASTIKASYARRIQRPSLFFVNPFINFNDPFSITTGNPTLEPELTDQFELNYGTFSKGFSLNATVFYRSTQDVIQRFQEEVDAEGVSRTTFLNVGENESAGINLFSSVNIGKRVTLRGGANIFTFNTRSLINGQRLSNEALLFNGNINGSYDIGKGFILEAFGFYRAPQQTVQGKIASFSLLSMGLKKEFNKRLSLGLNATEPFFRFKEFPNEISGPGFYQRSLNAVLFRSIGITASYRFGKLDFRQRRRGSKIQNDDLKNGGGAEF